MARVRMPKSSPLASYSTPRRWTDADARTVLSALDASGLSVTAFAIREGLDAQRLYFWRRRLEATSDGAPMPPALVEVHRRAAEHVEIVLRTGRVVRVSESIDAAVLRRLIHALEQDPTC